MSRSLSTVIALKSARLYNLQASALTIRQNSETLTLSVLPRGIQGFVHVIVMPFIGQHI